MTMRNTMKTTMKTMTATKMMTHSKRIGDNKNGMTITASFRQYGISWFVVECDKCKRTFDVKVTTWNGLRMCPLCKKDNKRTDMKMYYKYRRLASASLENNIPIAEVWDTVDKFYKWCEDNRIDGSFRIKLPKNVSQYDPYNVQFIKR